MSTVNGLQFFMGYSLVDVTATKVTRGSDNDDLTRNQQRNWETVIQCMGLRTQPQLIADPVVLEGDLKKDRFKFGDFYEGHHKIWQWTWAIDREGVYDLPNQPLGGLLKDFEQVPIIVGLEETARFMLPIFYPYGTIKNIYFDQINPN